MSENDNSEQEPGWEVKGKFYAVVPAGGFRMGTPILVRNVTDMTWGVFMDEIDAPKDERDPSTLIGLMAASVYKHERNWSRSETVKFVESLVDGDVKFVGPVTAEDDEDDEDAEGDAGPPSQDGESTSTDSPPASNGTAEWTSLSPSHVTSGQPDSVTGAPA